MTLFDEAKLATTHAARREFRRANEIYRAALGKSESPEMVSVIFQDRFVDAIQIAGLESNNLAFDNLTWFVHWLWEPGTAWELICKRLVRVACEADKADKPELAWAARQMMVRSRPPGISKYEAKRIFVELSGLGNIANVVPSALVQQEAFAS